TYDPVLIYMGGMQVTPLPTKQPSRMLDPPGTMRTPFSAVTRFTGHVALSRNGRRTGSIDISTTAPIRNPISTPFFTHGFTRHPLREEESGSAERTRHSFISCLKCAKRAKWSSV